MDFSGYSEIYIGFAHLLAVQAPENFDSPIGASTITGFWHGRHICIRKLVARHGIARRPSQDSYRAELAGKSAELAAEPAAKLKSWSPDRRRRAMDAGC